VPSVLSSVTYGKWILAGEHAVLRGSPALAFPLLSRRLELGFEPADDLDVSFAGPHGDELKLLFPGVLESALGRLGQPLPPRGRFTVDSSLPVGCGLGASAALCGAVARWCARMGWLSESETYDFARGLEDLFHGESSGLDVAVSLGAAGVRFTRGRPFETIRPAWWPKLYLSYSGQRGITSECVNKVKRLFVTEPERARAIDDSMREAVEMLDRALCDPEGKGDFANAIDLARGCFEAWELCPPNLQKHLDLLTNSGARAAKPTGSGGGGYVLSLWDENPPRALGDTLISVGEMPTA
jgi:mevalonate kinase